MFNGKNKALTLSFDDGVQQDIRFINILDKYGLKATFNLNSDLLGKSGELSRCGKKVSHNKVNPSDISKIYKNHEISVHTLTHPLLTSLSKDEIIHEVEDDRIKLSNLCGYNVVGMAYPCGGENNDDRVAQIIKDNTNVRYCRTITSSYSFDIQKNLFRFNPSVYHLEFDKMNELAYDFINLKTDKPQIFYIWGHTYEFDINDTWEQFEDFCKIISGHDDIFYGTNKEVLL